MRTAAIARYSPDATPCRIDLSDNTNAWGMPPAARAAITSMELSARYPSAYSDELKTAISAYVGLPIDSIATGCGSDDVLDAAIRAFGRPGDRLVYPAPTFVMIPAFASLNGLVPEPTPLDRLATSGARVIYLCSPNNPTGQLVIRSDIEAVLRQATSEQVVIVDEAYAEFAGESVVDLVAHHAQLVVTRTMSKAFGLAGLRVGYVLASPERIAAIETSRGPYMVSAVAEQAAVAALTIGRDWMRSRVALAIESRERLVVELRQRGLEPLDSAANFVFVPIPNALAVAAEMASSGVRVRAFGDPAGLRITVAPWPILQDALRALDEARRCA